MSSKPSGVGFPVAEGPTSPECPSRRKVGPSSPQRAIAERQCRPSSSSIGVLECDVLLGRGKLIHTHPGNILYRKAIKARSRLYQREENQGGKQEIAVEVIQEVRDRGGRFLRPSGDNGNWEECPGSVVRTKVKQALRDIIKERSPSDVKRVKMASASSTNRPRGLLLQPPERTSAVSSTAAVKSPSRRSTIHDHTRTTTVSSQLSRIDELAVFIAAANRQPMTGMTSRSLRLLSAATFEQPGLAAALLEQQRTGIIPMPMTTPLFLTQLDRSRLASAATLLQLRNGSVDLAVPHLQQHQLQSMGSNVPLMHSYAGSRGIEQQVQLLSLSRSEKGEIDEVIRGLRYGR